MAYNLFPLKGVFSYLGRKKDPISGDVRDDTRQRSASVLPTRPIDDFMTHSEDVNLLARAHRKSQARLDSLA